MTVKISRRAEGMQRAYSVLKASNITTSDDKVTIKGIATTPSVDSYGDIVVPEGAQFRTPMPLLWMHEHAFPVGRVTFAQPTKSGIPFAAELPLIKEAGRLKDRVDEAIHSVKYDLVTAVSIGFHAIDDEYEYLDGGGIKFNKWKWVELSLVTVGANGDAVINAIKSSDHTRATRERGVRLIK